MLKNLQHERFCSEYIIDHNGTQAAIRAGYSSETAAQQASRLLKREDVRTRIEEKEKNICDSLGLTAAWVVEKWMKVAVRCMQAEPVMVFNPVTKEMEETGEYAFDSRGVNNALENLGKYLGILDKKNVTVETEGTKIRVTLDDD